MDSAAHVSVVDLLGQGTATLVWSSPLPAADGRQVMYVDLMGGKKPHLLKSVVNNLGAETTMTYAPSTKFYLADKAAGTPWLTRLAFPVHVVAQIDRTDAISKSHLTTTYSYHHGFFDGVEPSRATSPAPDLLVEHVAAQGGDGLAREREDSG